MKKSDILKIIADNIKLESVGISEHNAISKYLKQYEGKLMNGNIFKKLPDNMQFRPQYGMYYIKFKDTGNEHLIGYNSNPYVLSGGDPNKNGSGFEYFDCCYGNAAAERNQWLKELQANPAKFDEFCTLFINMDKAYRKLAGFLETAKSGEFSSFRNPVYYSLIKAIFPERIYKAI